MTTRHFIATKAVIERDGKILLLRENPAYSDGLQAGLYDVVGGRNKAGETKRDGLRREVMEETGLTVHDADLFHVDDVTLKKDDEQWVIQCYYYACHIPDGDVKLSQDHDDYRWVDLDELDTIKYIPRLKTIFDAYMERFEADEE